MRNVIINNTTNKRLILIIISLCMIFLHNVRIFGIEISLPIFTAIFVAYTSYFFGKRKEYDFLTIITSVFLLIGIIGRLYVIYNTPLIPYEM